MANPIFEAVLIGITDSEDDTYFKIIPNSDGFFQVIAGCTKTGEASMANRLYEVIYQAFKECPFSNSDAELFELILASERSKFSSE